MKLNVTAETDRGVSLHKSESQQQRVPDTPPTDCDWQSLLEHKLAAAKSGARITTVSPLNSPLTFCNKKEQLVNTCLNFDK